MTDLGALRTSWYGARNSILFDHIADTLNAIGEKLVNANSGGGSKSPYDRVDAQHTQSSFTLTFIRNNSVLCTYTVDTSKIPSFAPDIPTMFAEDVVAMANILMNAKDDAKLKSLVDKFNKDSAAKLAAFRTYLTDPADPDTPLELRAANFDAKKFVTNTGRLSNRGVDAGRRPAASANPIDPFI
jgi:hypothetical protein